MSPRPVCVECGARLGTWADICGTCGTEPSLALAQCLREASDAGRMAALLLRQGAECCRWVEPTHDGLARAWAVDAAHWARRAQAILTTTGAALSRQEA